MRALVAAALPALLAPRARAQVCGSYKSGQRFEGEVLRELPSHTAFKACTLCNQLNEEKNGTCVGVNTHHVHPDGCSNTGPNACNCTLLKTVTKITQDPTNLWSTSLPGSAPAPRPPGPPLPPMPPPAPAGQHCPGPTGGAQKLEHLEGEVFREIPFITARDCCPICYAAGANCTAIAIRHTTPSQCGFNAKTGPYVCNCTLLRTVTKSTPSPNGAWSSARPGPPLGPPPAPPVKPTPPPVPVTPVPGLPPSFDARDRWPGSALRILDQGRCGSCWTFGSSEALSDRFFIASDGAVNVSLSPQELVSCDSRGSTAMPGGQGSGCRGGNVVQAWQWMMQHGMPTCDDACTTGCDPYLSGTCGESGANVTTGCQTCPADNKCPGTGDAMDLYYAASAKPLSSYTEMMTELHENGPITVGFNVYTNFQPFFRANPKGVYNSTENTRQAGAHGVKIIGWGEQEGIPYWLIANSWNTNFADGGFFKIRRGSDFCKIESRAPVAGMPKLTGGPTVVEPGMLAEVPGGGEVGGWFDTDAGHSHIQNIARAAVAAAPALTASAARAERVRSARTQVVAGLNVLLDIDVAGAGRRARCAVAAFEGLDGRVSVDRVDCGDWA